MDRLVKPEQIDFSESASTAVVSDSLRFILPVPVLEHGGEPLRIADGSPLRHSDGSEAQGRGIVFFDPNDQCWEVARGDGSDVIVFSPIDEPQASALADKIGHAPELLTLIELKRIIGLAHTELGIAAAYSTSRAYVAAAMTPTAHADSARQFGLYRRRINDVCRAVYIPGRGGFVGAGATPQRFDNGAVILRHGDSIRLVQCASFEATYRRLDGRPAMVAELPLQTP